MANIWRGSDDWLIGIEVDPRMDGVDDIEVSALNISVENSRDPVLLSGSNWYEEPSVSISGPFLLLNNETRLDLYYLESDIDPFAPVYSINTDFDIEMSDIGQDQDGSPLIIIFPMTR